MVRVLQVYPQLNNAGTEMVIMNLYRNIDREKVQFDFLVQKKGELDSKIKEMGAKIYYIEKDKNYKQKLNCFFKDHKEFRIVHTHMHQEMGMVLKQAAKNGITYRIAHSHNARVDLPEIFRVYKMVSSYNIEKYATHFVACSEEAARWLFPRRYRECVVWKNAIEMERFLFSQELRIKKRRELGIPEKAKVVCHVGRFAKQKNHERILSILNDMMKKNQELYALLVGVGPLLNEMKQIASTDRIKFLGNRTDVPDILDAADMFLFPSLYEGLGIVAVEAQTNGLYCLASTNIPKSADLNNGCFAQLELKEENDRWERTILKLLEISDLEERKRKSLDALKTEYNIKVIAKNVQTFYLELGAGNGE